MAFEIFSASRKYAVSGAYVSIGKYSITLSAEAAKEFPDPCAVFLLWDAGNRLVAVKPTLEFNNPDCFGLTNQRASKRRVVGCRKFLEHIGAFAENKYNCVGVREEVRALPGKWDESLGAFVFAMTEKKRPAEIPPLVQL